MRSLSFSMLSLVLALGSLLALEALPFAQEQGAKTEWRETAKISLDRPFELYDREKIENGRVIERSTWRTNPAGFNLEDIRHGLTVRYYDDGTISSESWYSMNIHHGPSREWYRSGQLKRELSSVEGRAHGLERIWYDGGQLRMERPYLGGRVTGTFKEWNEKGQQVESTEYKWGKRTGLHTAWHENGNTRETGEYVGDLKSRRWTYWHENGQKQSEGEYQLFRPLGQDDVDSRKVGEWKFWDEEGKLIRTVDHGEPEPDED